MVNLQEEEDLFNTVRVSARRFEESPFLKRQSTEKMIRGVYANRFFAVYNGEDPLEKYWTLRRKAVLFDVPEKPIEISGSDAVPFLEKVLIVAISSNRGLCGGFNANITKRCMSLLKETYADKDVSFFCIGKKVSEWLTSRELNVVTSEVEIFSDLNFQNVTPIAESVMAEFVSGKYDKVVLLYNHFKNAATQLVQEESFLPIITDDNQESSNFTDYIYEPNKESIITELIPKSLKTQFYKAVLDSVAGEHGARMTAMHKATDNANELANDLTLEYNKARQAAITTEILEIVGGAEALKA